MSQAVGRYFREIITIGILWSTCVEAGLRHDLTVLGRNFEGRLSGAAADWLIGRSRLPVFTEGLRLQVDSLALNTTTPPQMSFEQLIGLDPSLRKDPARMIQILGMEWDARGSFMKALAQQFVRGDLHVEYNFFVDESKRLACSVASTPFGKACSDLRHLGIGLLFGYYVSQDLLVAEAIPIAKLVPALARALASQPLSPAVEVGIASMSFILDGDPGILNSIGYRLNQTSNIFSEFSSGTLGWVDSRLLALESAGAYRNQFINQFRNAVDTVTASNSDSRRGWLIVGQAVQRIESLKVPLREIARRFPDDSFSAQELYSGLGLLNQYYSARADFVRLDGLRRFRAQLRSEFEELTEHFLERLLLRLWGTSTAYGTSIAFLTFLVASLVALVLILCCVAEKSLLVGFEACLRVLTIRSIEADLWGVRWLVLSIEAMLFVLIPTYFSFLVTFLLRIE